MKTSYAKNQHSVFPQGTDGIALLAVVLMIVGVLAIISMVSTQRLILLAKMCSERIALWKANYIAESAKAHALYQLYHLYSSEELPHKTDFDTGSGQIFDSVSWVTNYVYQISYKSDWVYRIDAEGYCYPYGFPDYDSVVDPNVTKMRVVLTIYADKEPTKSKFEPISEFISESGR